MQKEGPDMGLGLTALLRIVETDARLSPAHVAVLLALFARWLAHGCLPEFPISRSKLMGPGKIKSIVTYHKVISDLQTFGYITYRPSYHPGIGTIVEMHL